MFNPRIRRIALLALALLTPGGLAVGATPHMTASAASARSAPVSDVRAGLLQATDLPASVASLRPHVKVYAHFKRRMTVEGTYCKQKPKERTGWQQGAIETFSGSSPELLILCISRYATADAAHAAFAIDAGDIATLPKGQSTAQWNIVSSGVGDESIAVGGSQDGMSLYQGVFRHSNVSEVIAYLGDTALTWEQFRQLESVADTRLQQPAS